MITIMTEADLDQVTTIEKSSNPSPWPRSFFEGEILSSFSYPFVAREGNRVLGFIVLWKILSEGHIADFAVRVERRGQGIGLALLHHALDFSIKKGISEITVTVRLGNIGGIRVYEKVGFIRETTFSDFGNSLLLFLACDGLPAKEHNFKMPLDKGTIHQSHLSYMREILEPVFASKICRETRKAMNETSLWQEHMVRIDQIQKALKILQRNVG